MTASLSLPSAGALAGELMRQHLGTEWQFRFDHAKRRAGACHYHTREITVSRYFIAQATADEFRQVLLHEIAHALAGPATGHGPVWRRTARSIGYTGRRTLGKDFAGDLAAWVGTCPGGHSHRRFRKPKHTASCSKCWPRFDARYVIEWRFIPPELRGPR